MENGKYAYEFLEEGYLQAIYKGYLLMLQTLSHPLTPDLYEELHDAAVDGLKTNDEPNGVPKGFRTWSDGKERFFVYLNQTLSEKGFLELQERYNTYVYQDAETGDPHYFLKEAMDPPFQTISLTGGRNSHITLKATRPETSRANINACLEVYRQRPKNTEKEILSAIGRLCQDLNQFHVFVDGNIRTTGILLLNRLLLEHNLSPCALEDVNVLDCLSEEELVDCILEGQNFFRFLQEDPKK